MNRFAHLLFCGFFALSASAEMMAPPPSLDDPDIVDAWVDGVVKPLMKNNNSPSGTVAIAHNGRLVVAKGFGFQDIERNIPVDPEQTLFRPGSTSKLFTWVAVMQQVERGNLDLDTDVNSYLTRFKIKETYEQPITLRHILTHTAGFEDGSLGYLIQDDPAKAALLADAMERYQPLRVNPPGVQTAYSNYATALAGLIVANVSGLSFNEYIQKNIFTPLGMKRSSFVEPLPEKLAAGMAQSYVAEQGKYVEKPFEIITGFGPAGALSSTSTDMIRFGQAILNGGELDGSRILRSETVNEMLTRNFSQDDRLLGMALGFYESDYNGFRVLGHGGDTQYFHSFLGIDQENSLTFFVSFTAAGGSPVRSSFATSFYDEFFPREEIPPVPPKGFTAKAGKYAGQYGFWRSNFSKIEKALGLASSVSIVPTKDDALMISLFGKAKQYVEIDSGLFRELESNFSLVPGISPRLLAFQTNDDGAVTGFVMDGLPFMSLRKLAFYETPNFNIILLGISMLVFLWVLLRHFFQRSAIRALPGDDRSALSASVYASAANWLVVVFGVVVISVVKDQIFSGIPLLFKLWLVLPIVATLAGIYLIYRTYGVWRQSLLAGFWARIRFSLVTLCALFLCWFYYFWNILGFQYY